MIYIQERTKLAAVVLYLVENKHLINEFETMTSLTEHVRKATGYAKLDLATIGPIVYTVKAMS